MNFNIFLRSQNDICIFISFESFHLVCWDVLVYVLRFSWTKDALAGIENKDNHAPMILSTLFLDIIFPFLLYLVILWLIFFFSLFKRSCALFFKCFLPLFLKLFTSSMFSS